MDLSKLTEDLEKLSLRSPRSPRRTERTEGSSRSPRRTERTEGSSRSPRRTGSSSRSPRRTGRTGASRKSRRTEGSSRSPSRTRSSRSPSSPSAKYARHTVQDTDMDNLISGVQKLKIVPKRRRRLMKRPSMTAMDREILAMTMAMEGAKLASPKSPKLRRHHDFLNAPSPSSDSDDPYHDYASARSSIRSDDSVLSNRNTRDMYDTYKQTGSRSTLNTLKSMKSIRPCKHGRNWTSKNTPCPYYRGQRSKYCQKHNKSTGPKSPRKTSHSMILD